MSKRKVCFVITSGIHYARSRHILEKIREHKDLELQIIVGGSALLSNYSDVLSTMDEHGFVPDARITMTIEGGNSVAMAKTTGIGITEFTTAFDNLQPDMVIVRGDRYEVLSAAVASAYLNIPLVHIEGGDVSGTLDESVRHAITKLAHVHLTTNEDAKRRILRMGENPEYVFMVGSPEVEFIHESTFEIDNEYIRQIGVGGENIDVNKPYIIVMQHPVTTEVGKNRNNIEETLAAVDALKIPTIWFWPNIDAGTDEISKGIRVYREHNENSHIRFIKYLPPEKFIGLLKKAACLVGNSSAGIKEASFIGIPVVNIGSRQNGRLKSENVVDVDYDRVAIQSAIEKQLAHGFYDPSHLYFKENVSDTIVDILANVKLYTQKKFFE